MTRALSPRFSAAVHGLWARSPLSPPPWVMELAAVGDAAPSEVRTPPPLEVSAIDLPRHSLVRVDIPHAPMLGPQQLEELTVRAYNAIFERLAATPTRARHPVRFWNYLPNIHQDMGDGRDRYMVFNAGRFKAFENWYGGRDAFDGSVATASAVGHGSEELVIYCLAADAPVEPLDNPRQIKPYRYSARFGPLPPCFARATILDAAGPAPLLLVGGTASIRGEDSVFPGDLARQTDETFENLAALARAALARCTSGTAPMEDAAALLGRYRELRVYYPEPRHAPELRSRITAACPRLGRLQMLQANLCRSELLVEIEGIADLAC